jgi:hypothetical protein
LLLLGFFLRELLLLRCLFAYLDTYKGHI